MSAFVLTPRGVVLNRTAAAEGRVPIAAWDIGAGSAVDFLSSQGAPFGVVAARGGHDELVKGRWEAVSGPVANQILVTSNGREIGQVNSRAAAILGPLLQGRLIDLEFQQNQQAGGASGRALYIFAKVGVEGNAQLIREPQTTEQMRAYVALLACTMQALKDVSRDRAAGEGPAPMASSPGPSEPLEEGGSTWRKLPGTLQWDSATGSVGNTVNSDLIDLLGSRTLAALRDSGAPRVSYGSRAE